MNIKSISVAKEMLKIYNFREKIAFILNCFQSVFSELAFGGISWYIFDALFQEKDGINFAVICLTFIVIYFIFLIPLWGYLMEVGKSKVKKHFSNLLIERYFSASPSNVNKLHSSYLLELLQVDIAKISEYGSWDTVVLFQAMISGCVAALSFAMISWKILFLLLFLGIIPIAFDIIFANKNRVILERARNLYEEKAQIMLNVIDNYSVLKLYDAMNQSIDRIIMKHNEMTDVQEKVYAYNNRINFIHDLIYQGVYRIVILIGGLHLYRQGEVTVGAIAFMLSMSEGISFFLNDVGNYFRNVQELNISRDRIQECVNEKLDLIEFSDFNRDKLETITLQNVSFKYSDKDFILKNVNYKFVYSNNYLILGDNGIGKSTLLKLLFGLYLPDDGKIIYNESDCGIIYNNRISFVSQEPKVFSGTLKENLLNENVQSSIYEMKKVLEIVKLDDLAIERCIIGENGDNFSKGQRTRIVLARALLQKPNFLLLDELDANIDETTLNNILDNIGKWSRKCCIIAISHNKSYKGYRGFKKLLVEDKYISELSN